MRGLFRARKLFCKSLGFRRHCVYDSYMQSIPDTKLPAKRRYVNFEVDESTIAEIDRLAEKGFRSRSAEVRLAVMQHLAANRDETKDAA